MTDICPSCGDMLPADEEVLDLKKQLREANAALDDSLEELETNRAAVDQVRALATDDADLRSGVAGMVRVNDIRRALEEAGDAEGGGGDDGTR